VARHYDRAGAFLKGMRTRELRNIAKRRQDVRRGKLSLPFEGFPPAEVAEAACERLDDQLLRLGAGKI
jgi:hypothetical protein